MAARTATPVLTRCRRGRCVLAIATPVTLCYQLHRWGCLSTRREADALPHSQAHRVNDFKVSPNTQFVDKVRDVVGLNRNPQNAAVVLCADDETRVQALDRTAPILPMSGSRNRASHD